eukprot:gb/GECG01000051.1/.p1 GENE.gb/GECG01000051.1/~~gb/GECG01000051.1/.p1  ORF type:complete len:441 (+),score=6.95 gb/GECG01000051.1/:1-1323(+)
MDRTRKQKVLILQYFCFTVSFFILCLTAHFLYGTVADASKDPVDPMGQQDVNCRNNFFVYWDCRGERYDALGLESHRDKEYSDRFLLVLFLGFVFTCPSWGYSISSYKDANSLRPTLYSDDRVPKCLAVVYPILFAGICFQMAYGPVQQGSRADMLLAMPGDPKYGPVFFNGTEPTFALTNHPPESLNDSSRDLFLSVLGEDQRVVSLMAVQKLRIYCPIEWTEEMCQLGMQYGVCSADIQVNEKGCGGTRLYRQWKAFWLLIKYIIPTLVGTDFVTVVCLLAECSNSPCRVSQSSHGSDNSRQRTASQVHRPSGRSEGDRRLASQLQYFFYLHPPRDINRGHREASGIAALNRIEWNRSDVARSPRGQQRRMGSADADRRVTSTTEEECCICYESLAEYQCASCHNPVLCSRCRNRIYDHSVNPAVYGRCPVCRAFGSI